MSNFKKIFKESFGMSENWVPMSSPKGPQDPRNWQMSEAPVFTVKDATGAVEYRVFHFQCSELPPSANHPGIAASEGWFIIPYFNGTPHNPHEKGAAPFPQFFKTPKEAIKRAKNLASSTHDEEGMMADFA